MTFKLHWLGLAIGAGFGAHPPISSCIQQLGTGRVVPEGLHSPQFVATEKHSEEEQRFPAALTATWQHEWAGSGNQWQHSGSANPSQLLSDVSFSALSLK